MHLVPVTPDFAAAKARWDGLTDRERAAWVVAVLIEKKLEKTELAERLGMKYGSVLAWTSGDSNCDWARWIAITAAVGLPQTWGPKTAQLDAAQREVDALRPAPKKRKRGKAGGA